MFQYVALYIIFIINLIHGIESIQILSSEHNVPTIVIYIDRPHMHREYRGHQQPQPPPRELKLTSSVRTNISNYDDHDECLNMKQPLVHLHYDNKHDDYGNNNNGHEHYQLKLVNGHRYHRISLQKFNLNESILHVSSGTNTFGTIKSTINETIDRIQFHSNGTNRIYSSKDLSTFLIVNHSAVNPFSIKINGLIENKMLIMPTNNSNNDTDTDNVHRICHISKYHRKQLKSLIDHYKQQQLLLWNKQVEKMPNVPSVIYPEITLIIDYHSQRPFTHQTNATLNYALMFMQMLQSLFFQSINRLKIDLHLKQILIINKPFEFQTKQPELHETLLVSNQNSNRTKYMNAMNALQQFGYWINDHYDQLESDLFLLLTDYDLCLHFNSTNIDSCSYSSIKGEAIVGGACEQQHKNNDQERYRASNVAIVEDNGWTMNGLQVMAHELAHLLGAVHDGEWPMMKIGGPGAVNCNDGKSFLMNADHSKSVVLLEDQEGQSLSSNLKWSECTIEQFKHFLTLEKSMCLFNHPFE